MTQVLKPGILVSLRTTLTGGVSYHATDLLSLIETGGAHVAQWKTMRRTEDPIEHDRAAKVRANAAAKVRAVCTNTAFGLLCPEAKKAELDAAIEEARGMVAAFNATAVYSQLGIYMLTGRIAESDTEAARAIASEVSGLLADIEAGIRGADPKGIRDACTRARALGAVLDDSQAKVVSDAVKAARDAARAIVKRVQKDGEDAQAVIAELSVKPIETARFAFLDLADPLPATDPAPALPAVDLQRFASVEETPEAPAPVSTDAPSETDVENMLDRIVDMVKAEPQAPFKPSPNFRRYFSDLES